MITDARARRIPAASILGAFSMDYRYLGDRHTDPALRGALCAAVRNRQGRCIRGRNGSMLVRLEDGRYLVVVGRLLRKLGKG